MNTPRMVRLGCTEEPFPAGTHTCHIFNDEAERDAVISGFIASGLEADEQFTYLADETSAEELRARLGRLGVALPAVEDRRFVVGSAVTTYCPDGTFVPDRMLATIRAVYRASLAEGFDGARATGEMSWALRGLPGSDRLIEYESRVNEVVREDPMTAICQYDARRFDGATLFEVMIVHPVMIVRGRICRNPYYVPPEEFLGRSAGVVGRNVA